MAAPPLDAIAALLAPSSQVNRRVDIYEEDGVTPFYLDAPFISGSVSVDMSRSERRTFDLMLDNVENEFDNYPGGFWYDKVIKMYRGIEWEGRTDSYLRINSGGYMRTADTPAFTLSGTTVSWYALLSIDTLVTANNQTIMSKDNGAGTLSWSFVVTTTGGLALRYSVDGAANVTITSTATLGSVGIVNGQRVGVAAVMVRNIGTSNKTWFFYYSLNDGVSWNLLGATVADAATLATQIFDSTGDAKIGVRSAGPVQASFAGNIYWLQHYDDSRTVIFLDFQDVASGEVAVSDPVLGTPWTMVTANISIAGGLIESQSWETQIGEFLIDSIATDNFPHVTTCSGRDYTKKLLEDKFPDTTTFSAGQVVENIIRTIALNGNITKFLLSNTGQVTGKDFTFENGTDRWTAISELATAYNLEVFFNPQGYLVLRTQVDPLTAPLTFTFETGEFGNLVKYTKRSGDTRIYNHIVVRGEATDQVPIVAEAENTEPSSPTSIANLNRRKTYTYTSAFFTNIGQAQAYADSLLKIKSLETYDIGMESIVIPWLEAAEAVEFIDPDPNPGDPTRFLLTDFTIPMSLGSMSATSKRVTVVG